MKVIITIDKRHDGHDWEPTETLMDNSVEFCAHAYCNDCQEYFRRENSLVETFDDDGVEYVIIRPGDKGTQDHIGRWIPED